jgi:uncharacterized protein YhaN
MADQMSEYETLKNRLDEDARKRVETSAKSVADALNALYPKRRAPYMVNMARTALEEDYFRQLNESPETGIPPADPASSVVSPDYRRQGPHQ